MAQENLIPFNQLTKEEQRELAVKGGKASVEARRRKKTLKEELLLLLETNERQEKISLAIIRKALTGDTKAFEIIRDTIGEKPIDQQEITTTDFTIVLGEDNGDI